MKQASKLKQALRLVVSGALAVAATLGAERAAEAAVVHVKLKAEVGVPFLVAHPPVPIVAPRRITMQLHHGGVYHTRLWGVGPVGVVHLGPRVAPFRIHARLPGAHIKVGGPHVGVKVKGPGWHAPGRGHGGGRWHGGKGKSSVKVHVKF